MNLKKIITPSTYINLKSKIDIYGVDYINYMLKRRLDPQAALYSMWYQQIKPDEKALEEQRNTDFNYTPKISIVVPVYKPPVTYLKEMLDSVLCQTYSNWELCIANASGDDKDIKCILNKYQQTDNRIKILFLDKNLGISENSNKALEMATGEYVAFLDHDDVIPCQALFEVASVLQEKRYDILYSDEDFISHDLKVKHSPQFKPDWSPHLLECHNYITHFFVVKKKLLDKVGYFDSKYDGAQDYDLILRCTEQSKNIYHIPKILYHWRVHKNSVAGSPDSKKYAYDAGKKALIDHFKRTKIDAKVEQANLVGYYHTIYPLVNQPLLSIIIPNKDHIEDLQKCIDSLLFKNIYKNIEIIIVENNSENKKTFNFYEDITNKYKNVTIIKYKAEFNYSAINNYASKFAKGKYLLFLNNDTELITADGIVQMLGCCMLPDVGIVGAKLLYEDNTVQHAGIVLGFGGYAGHVFNGIEKDHPGYANKACLSYDCSAVTGACLMISKSLFEEIDGFSEDYKIAVSDVDLCLKSSAKGVYTVCDNFVKWYHYESKSRGSDEKNDKSKERFKHEKILFKKRWTQLLEAGDPFYNNNFLLNCSPYTQKIIKDIVFSIDRCDVTQRKKDDKYLVKLAGWCVSEFDNPIEIKLYINNICKDDLIEKVARPDLFNISIAKKINNQDGFKCNTIISKKDEIKIVFTTRNNNKEVKFTLSQLNELSNQIKQERYNDDKRIKYNAWYNNQKPSDRELKLQEQFNFKINPLFSIVIPLYQTPKKFLTELIESLINQTYKNWEVCFSDGSGPKNNLEKFIKKWTKKDNRIKYIKSDKPLQISDNTNLALSIVSGDYILFGDHDDLFESNALYECAKVLNEDPSVEMIYTDEDKIDMEGSIHFDPHFKPDFNLDMLRSENYICHMCVVSKNLYKKVGKLRSEYDGAQDFDFVLRCSEKTNNIRHIPMVLYNWRAHLKSTAGNSESKNYAYISGAKAVQAHLDRQGIKANVKQSRFKGIYKTNYIIDDMPLVSVVICYRRSADNIKKCVDSLFNINNYKNFEVFIVDDGTKNINISKYYSNIIENPKINVVNYNKDNPNYADCCNLAAKYTNGDFILFMHQDTEIIEPNSVKEMLMYCNRKEVGAVGAKMYYEDDTIQHAGITLGPNGKILYNFEGLDRNEDGYVAKTKIVYDVSAVSSACMMTRKDAFLKVEGFDSKLVDEFCDVDYCLKLGKRGYLIVFTPYAQLMHYKRRYFSYEDFLSKERRDSKIFFTERWANSFKKGDINYNPNYVYVQTDFDIK